MRVTGAGLGLLAVLVGCGTRERSPASDLRMSDAAAVGQLIAGFYPPENNQWRWAARRFAVVLKPPAGAFTVGARLRLDFYLPDAQVKRLGPVTLEADAGGLSLPAQTFRKGGSCLYSEEIPAAQFHTLLPGTLLPVVFTLDKSIPRGAQEGRDLGAVVTEVSLRSLL